jgi:predicted component of type VI protein secretion system
MKAELVPESGAAPIPITKDVTIVGRKPYCDVVVDDPSLSKRHCILVKTDGLLVVRDLATTNGTKVKGQRVRWAALLPDDRLTFGAVKFRVYLGPDDAASPSERAGRGGLTAPPRKPAVAAMMPSTSSSSGFPAPSPLAVPAVSADVDDVLEILDDDDDASDDSGDSGWRSLIASKLKAGDDDVVIDLE